LHNGSRPVRHFSLHRIGNTELRVVSDVEAGVIPFIEIEEGVLAQYARTVNWPHQVVTLFVLQDLEPLLRHLSRAAASPPGVMDGLGHKPVVNVYDAASLQACHVFVNQQAMTKEGYWDDQAAVRALLAHEHAHPLAECQTTRSSRMLKLNLSCQSTLPLSPSEAGSKEWMDKIHGLLTEAAEKLCVHAPREIFANDVTIRSGFSDSLFHLDLLNVQRAAQGVASRKILQRQLEAEESLTPAGANLMLVIGDIKGHLDLALETASFYRQEKIGEAKELERILFSEVMSSLEPEVGRAYERLRDTFVAFPTDTSPQELAGFVRLMVNILAAVLAAKGLQLEYDLSVTEK